MRSLFRNFLLEWLQRFFKKKYLRLILAGLQLGNELRRLIGDYQVEQIARIAETPSTVIIGFDQAQTAMKDRAKTVGNGRDEKLKERLLIPIKLEENCPATQLRLCLLPNLATQR